MIFCVDDDNTIRDIEVYTLEQTGFKAKGFSDGVSLLQELSKTLPRLILLDIMLPDMDGVKILEKIRKNPKTASIPVIMATAKGTEMDKIQSLDLGADDYLVKPFGVMEMVSRIKAVLRRCEKKENKTSLSVGEITLCADSRAVQVGIEKLSLTKKEFELLHVFMENPKVVHTREKLLSLVWGEDFLGESRTIDMHIKTLRRKLGNEGKRIETVIGVGYRMEDK